MGSCMNNHMFRYHYCCSILRFDKDSNNKDQRLTNQSKETRLRGTAMHVQNFLPMLSCSLFNYLPGSFILYVSICSSVRMLLFCCDIRSVKTLTQKRNLCLLEVKCWWPLCYFSDQSSTFFLTHVHCRFCSRLRACLHGGGVHQIGEVTRLGGVTRLSI